MRQRAIVIVVAVLLGLAAAFMVTSYADRAKYEAVSGSQTVDVLVADKTAPLGLTLDELRSRQFVKVRKVPKTFVADGAVMPATDVGKRVLAVRLSAGRQLTVDDFRLADDAGLAYTVPQDMVAVAIPIDDMKAAGNLVKVGDYVNVVGTAKSTGEKEFTKTFLQTVRVLAVGTSLVNEDKSSQSTVSQISGGSPNSAGKTVTLALTQADAEKLIYMQDQGRIWLTLLPSKEAKAVTTGGQTIDSVFK